MVNTLLDPQNSGDLLESAVETYLSGRASNTQRAYRGRLRRFTEWFYEQPTAPFVAQLRKYIAYLQAEGLSERSVQAHVNTIKGVIRMAAALDASGQLAAALPTLELAKPPAVRGQIQGDRLTADQRDELIDTPGVGSHKGRRDTVILVLLSVCGLRRAEVASLNWRHITQLDRHPVVRNLKGKHGRTRTVKMPPGLLELLRRYGELADLDMSPDAPVFVSIRRGDNVQHGQRLTPSAIAWLVKEYTGQIDADGVSPHDLRRTAASLARQGGASIEQVQIMLGHANPQTTSEYIGEGLDLEDHAVDYSQINLG